MHDGVSDTGNRGSGNADVSEFSGKRVGKQRERFRFRQLQVRNDRTPPAVEY